MSGKPPGEQQGSAAKPATQRPAGASALDFAPAAQAAKAGVRHDKKNPIGRALRSVYDDTLGEKIPNDLLDLLGKLG